MIQAYSFPPPMIPFDRSGHEILTQESSQESLLCCHSASTNPKASGPCTLTAIPSNASARTRAYKYEWRVSALGSGQLRDGSASVSPKEMKQ